VPMNRSGTVTQATATKFNELYEVVLAGRQDGMCRPVPKGPSVVEIVLPRPKTFPPKNSGQVVFKRL
jgi:hypothetical protein